jgi:hypothetical protein
MFILYLDVFEELDCNVSAFADDTQLYVSGAISDLQNLVNRLNDNIGKFEEWCATNGLVINPAKSKAIIFTSHPNLNPPNVSVGGVELSYSDSIKVLGVSLSRDMKWEKHVSNIVRNIFCKLKMMHPFGKFLKVGVKRRLFYTLVYPHITYCSSVFSGSLQKEDFRKLNRSFNSFVRFVFDRGKRDHVSHLLPHLIKLSLESLYSFRRAITMFDILRSFFSPLYLKSEVSSVSNSSWSGKAPLKSCILSWNAFGPEVRRTGSKKLFKNQALRVLRLLA